MALFDIKFLVVASLIAASCVQGFAMRALAGASEMPALFAAERNHELIDLFSSSGRLLGRIHGFAGNIATDRQGDLYVADWNSNTHIQLYAPPYMSASSIQLQPGQIGVGIAVDKATSVFAVLSIRGCCSNEPEYISFFQKGAKVPCSVIKSRIYLGDRAAFDSKSVLYYEEFNSVGQFSVASLPGECHAKASSVRILQFKKPIVPDETLNFDSSDNLVIQEVTSNAQPGNIYTYRHPENGIIGDPIAVSVLPNVRGHIPGFLAISADGKHLWTATLYGGTEILRFPYPTAPGTPPDLTINNVPGVESGAVFPPLTP